MAKAPSKTAVKKTPQKTQQKTQQMAPQKAPKEAAAKPVPKTAAKSATKSVVKPVVKSAAQAASKKTSSVRTKAPVAKEASIKKAKVEIVDHDDRLQADVESDLTQDALGPLDAESALSGELEFPVGDADIDPDFDTLSDPLIAGLREAAVNGPPPIAKKERAVKAQVVRSTAKADTEESSSKVLATVDPIATYLAEIRKYPLLTKEQEHELALRYREQGDAKAAEALVTANLRFVVKVAAEYSRFGAKLIDLVQEGNVGLMHAVREFNPYKGVRLITYAVWWIRGYIQEYLMRQYSMVRIGTTQNQRKLFYRLQKEREKMDAQGMQPTSALLAGRLGVTEEEVETMTQRMSGRDVSLSQPLDSESSSGASLLDLEEAGDLAVDESLGSREELEVLHKNLEDIRPDLGEKEVYLLEHRILSDEPETLQEIGDHFGVTREAVRQLEVRLINKIRKAFTASLGE